MNKPIAKRRNPVARSPLLRKGGVHQKSKTVQRVRSRLAVDDAINQWYEEQDINDEQDEHNQKGATAPFFYVYSCQRTPTDVMVWR